jgi:outer membrane autotransporter protein
MTNITTKYDILHAGAVSGTFAAVGTTNLPAGFATFLTYTPTDVFLNLTSSLTNLAALNVNQTNVANAIGNFFNNGGTLTPNFLNLFNLTGGNLANALTKLDGEAATGGETAVFQSMMQFLGLMLDPFVDGRTGGGGGALGFAPDQEQSFPPDIALAYDTVLKAPPPAATSFNQRWSAWGSAYGGTATISGDPAVGSTNLSASTYGFAAGMDYHPSADTVVGFGLASGGTGWNLQQALGGGHSDEFQAGVYATKYFGPAYVAGALSVAENWMHTSRTALAGDQLTASFNAQSFGARGEAGYRYSPLPGIGVTPYGALQVMTFHTPSYSETDLTGGGFGLTYNAMTATDTRSELGARFSDYTSVNNMPLTLRARVAWAHDWVSDPSLTALFQTLPGANFVVNGAPLPKNSALTSAGAELKLNSKWSVLGKFDGEFARGVQTYAGTGTLRYSW